MAKFLSNRQQNLKIGINSYTDNKQVLEVFGNVGIKTSNTQDYELYISGDANVTGIISASSFYGDASNMTGIAVTDLSYGNSRISISSTDGSILLQSNDVLVASISSEKVYYYVPIDMGNNRITSLADPFSLNDASNKAYVDNLTGEEFPFGDYGTLDESSSDAFGQVIGDYVIFDCLTTPFGRVDEVDLELTY